MKFLIIVTGFNCERYVQKCINSVKAQTYKNYDVVFISDGSTDGTFEQINSKSPVQKHWHIEGWDNNKGAAFRRWNAIKNYCDDKETVIVLLGLDDELLPNALQTIKKEYDKGKWMTYGNWRNQHGKMLPAGFLNFDEITHTNRDYRKVKYRSTAPNTFKRFLFDELKEEDFQIEGKWIDSTTESPLMFACLEMCGKEKIGIIEDAIYLYNENLPGGTLRRLGVDYKYKIYANIITRDKKPLLIR